MSEQQKGSHWLLTINNPTEEVRIALRTLPKWCKAVKGQDEVGENGTLHLQVYLHTEHVRFSAIKKWLPSAHIEVARNPEAARNYVQKAETSVPGTQLDIGNTQVPVTMMENLIRLVAYIDPDDYVKALALDISNNKVKTPKQYAEDEYWRLVGYCIIENEDLLATYTMPNLRMAWINLSHTIKLIAARRTAGQTPRNEIVEPPASLGIGTYCPMCDEVFFVEEKFCKHLLE